MLGLVAAPRANERGAQLRGGQLGAALPPGRSGDHR